MNEIKIVCNDNLDKMMLNADKDFLALNRVKTIKVEIFDGKNIKSITFDIVNINKMQLRRKDNETFEALGL